jgi:hypothetical protein
MHRRVVAAVSVAVLLVSVAALVEAVQMRLDVRAPTVVPPLPAADAQHRPGTNRKDRASAPSADARRDAGSPSTAARHGLVQWRSVLAALDRRRARAYAAGEPHRLARVYVPGSAALRRDRALLRRYARRGLRVIGLRMRLTGMAAEQDAAGRTMVWVRERLAGGVVVGARARRRLPPGEPQTRVVTLRRVRGQAWRIAAVRPWP